MPSAIRRFYGWIRRDQPLVIEEKFITRFDVRSEFDFFVTPTFLLDLILEIIGNTVLLNGIVCNIYLMCKYTI